MLLLPGGALSGQAVPAVSIRTWYPIQALSPATDSCYVRLPADPHVVASPQAGQWLGLYAPWPDATQRWRHIEFESYIEKAANTVHFRVILRLNDDSRFWADVRAACRDGHCRLRVPLSGPEARHCWRPVDGPSWMPQHQQRISEVGIQVRDSANAWRLHTCVLGGGHAAPRLRYGCLQGPKTAATGERIELRLRVAGAGPAVFDRSKLHLRARVRTPSGRQYWTEGFADGDSSGMRLALRHLAEKPGTYTFLPFLTGRNFRMLPMQKVDVGEAKIPFRGYVRRHPDGQRLLHGDSSAFAGIGINLHAPGDKRVKAFLPGFEWNDPGIDRYRQLFPKFRAAGINVVEVWMSARWLGLEWRSGYAGYNGLGHYHQQNAARLDELIRLAAENDIYLVLALNHHGQFSTWVDAEWAENPNNERNGGPAASPEAFFTDPRARQNFRKRLDYIVARWGYSDRILAWKLLTEINLTGENRHFATDVRLTDWHREMANYLKVIDQGRHMVTTHWCTDYKAIHAPIAEIDAIDFLSVNAYHNLPRTADLLALLDGTRQKARELGKPVLITEYGGDWDAGRPRDLREDLKTGLRYAALHELSVSPMFWWVALVDQAKWYSEYAAVREFLVQAKTGRRDAWMSHIGRSGSVIGAARADDEVYISHHRTALAETEPTHIDFCVSELPPRAYFLHTIPSGQADFCLPEGPYFPNAKGEIQLELPIEKCDWLAILRPAQADVKNGQDRRQAAN